MNSKKQFIALAILFILGLIIENHETGEEKEADLSQVKLEINFNGEEGLTSNESDNSQKPDYENYPLPESKAKLIR